MRAFTFGLCFCVLAALSTPAKAYLSSADDSDAIAGISVTGENLGTQIDTTAFFNSIAGNYKILLAGGVVPTSDNKGTVEVDPGQIMLTFGYCIPNAGCDPGYIFLDPNSTKVYQNGNVYTITSVDDSGKAVKYTWTVEGNKISLKNYQYEMPNHTVVTLEHVIQKM